MRRVLEKSKILCISLRKLKHFPTIGAKYFKVDFDYRKVHINHMPIKTTPRH